ncbi:uncharacterized protein LOC142180004 [Nicotiana tabacum]|uniref:Uncharacterized protein LOC142180004 n=1 Tax=Nicotiana tabacum TaxID=4097 RepID=A0AC58UC09_TOBAC
MTQEIVTDIRLRDKPTNVVIKLDMAKAYDRVSWKYLMHVLRKMGFVECFINMVWNLIANNWYYVPINGQTSSFFHSTRGVKQGDPLSPALFILSVEVLSMSLNKLFEDKQFKGFGLPNWTVPLNHLAYADDTIVFASSDLYSLQNIVEVLTQYEHTSGQLINKATSSCYMHTNVAGTLVNTVGTTTHFSKGEFLFTYLGCPIFYIRRRKDYYNDLIKKVKAKLHSWKGKLLSYGGKETLISSVLQSMPTHILSVLDPHTNVLEHLHKTFARFFRSNKEEGRSRHWTKWQNLCLLKEEGGVGFRSLVDISKSLFAKRWWREGSHVWKRLLEAREEVEHEILWDMNRGSTNVWNENWTELGALYHLVPPDFHINEDLQEVAQLREGDDWNVLLEQSFPKDIADHIRQEVPFDNNDEYWDTPRWMPTASGRFTGVVNLYAWSRCSRESSPSTSSYKDVVEYRLLSKTQAFVPGSSSSDNIGDLEEGKHYETWRCNSPREGWFKCNTSGASRDNPGPSSYGFCVRNHDRELVFFKTKQIEDTTNIVAEAKAIVEGLAFCIKQQLHPLIVETDSLVMKRIIEDEWETPWSIGKEVKRIKGMKENFNVTFQHVLRESNTLADFLTNTTFSFPGAINFNSCSEMPSARRRLLNLDKAHIPNLKCTHQTEWCIEEMQYQLKNSSAQLDVDMEMHSKCSTVRLRLMRYQHGVLLAPKSQIECTTITEHLSRFQNIMVMPVPVSVGTKKYNNWSYNCNTSSSALPIQHTSLLQLDSIQCQNAHYGS